MSYYVLAVDPGKLTGMCFYRFDTGCEPVLMWSGEVVEVDFAGQVRSFIAWAQSEGLDLRIVCERFTINAQTAKKSQAPFSLGMIGVLKQTMRDYGISETELVFQAPSDAMAMFTNAKLKKLEQWHTGGEGHALDAIRHGLLYIVKNGWKPVKLLS